MTTSPGIAPNVPYVDDIHGQPQALQRLLDAGLGSEPREILRRITSFDRVVLTGMGASLFGVYPSYLRLLQAGLPVWQVDTAELLGPARGLITKNTLLWIVSQSGGTAEVVALLERLEVRPAAILGTTNDTQSGLADRADAVLELHSGAENTVGTRSYINTLTAMALATSFALEEAEDAELRSAPAAIASYLEGWQDHKRVLNRLVTQPTMFALGRGSALAATLTGALITKEAARCAVEGMSVPQFRHGPLEMTSESMSVLIVAGDPVDHGLNRMMQRELTEFGAQVAWIGRGSEDSQVVMPDLAGPLARPLAEIIPFQALSVVLAERHGTAPGAFHKIGKVTRTL